MRSVVLYFQVHQPFRLRRYTFFDQCLLAALPKAQRWRGVAAATDGCVHRMEQQLRARPSDPQTYYGAAVAQLTVGLRP